MPVSPDDSGDYLFVRWESFINSRFVNYERVSLGQDNGYYYFISAVDEILARQAAEDFAQAKVSIDSL